MTDLAFLAPELSIVGVVTVLALLEIFLPEISKRFSTRLNLLAVVGVGLALAGLSGHPGTAFGGTFAADPFALFFKFLFLLTTASVFVIRREHRPLGAGGEFPLLLWSALLGMFFLVSSSDFLLFFISLELLTLSLYILAAYTRTDRLAVEAGLKYLVMGSLASAFFLYGASLIYAATGTLSFETIQSLTREGKDLSWLFLAGLLLVLSALGFKVGAVPFQVWVPDVYQGAPTPVVAFLSVASKSAGFAGFLRILFEALGPVDTERRALFSLLAVMTLFYGNLGALVQKDMKRLLGFSSIAHAGFLLAALAGSKDWGPVSLLYYLIAYAVTNLTAFLVVAIVEDREGSSSLEAFRGLARRSPFLAGGLFLALLSLAGVPPLAGFFSKFLVLFALAQSELYGLIFLGAVNVAISLYYYLNVVRLIYFETAKDSSRIAVTLPSRILLFSLMAGILLVGLWQAPFFGAASRAVSGGLP